MTRQKMVLASGIVLAAICVVFGKTRAEAAAGDILQSFPFRSNDLVADPLQPYMYASVFDSNSVAIINTQTLSVYKTINLPGSPQSLSLTPDGKTLYVADSSNHSIDVIDTQTLSLTRSLGVSTTPYDVVPGLDNRLYVLDASNTYNHIEQIDATTGAAAGPAYGFAMYYGDLNISPDQRTLYYGEHGLSPTRLYSYEVSTTTITPLHSVQTGSNGQNVVVSHSGETIAQPNGAPYRVTLYRSSDLTALGTFDTGAYPNAITFSPDDRLAYVSHAPYPTAVDIYSTETFTMLGQFDIADHSSRMETDQTGQKLFVSCDGTYYHNSNTIVYDTGTPVPEPSTFSLLGIGAMGLLGWIRRRQKSCTRFMSMRNGVSKAAACLTVMLGLVATTALAEPIGKVAIWGDNDLNIADVRQKISGTGKFAQVDAVNLTNRVPALSEAVGYDAILLFGGKSAFSATKKTAVGNVLADYADTGRGVVTATFTLGSGQGGWIPGGRWNADRYHVMNPVISQDQNNRLCLGTVYDPSNPVMAGVTTLDGGASSYYARVLTFAAGSVRVADWSNGVPLVAVKELPDLGRRADLNFYPPSSTVRSDFWVVGTQGDLLMANALQWTASAPVPEPSTFALLGMGIIGLLGWAWRRRARPRLAALALIVFASANAVILQGAGRVEAATLTFDDLTEFLVPNGYGGLNWSNIRVQNGSNHVASGYSYGVVSPENIVFNPGGGKASVGGVLFTFNSAYFAGAWNDGLHIRAVGYRAAEIIYSTEFLVNTTEATQERFDWAHIDKVEFTSFGGIPHPFGGNGTHFVMDNFTYNQPVPEPSTIALLCMGPLGLLGYAWRRRKA